MKKVDLKEILFNVEAKTSSSSELDFSEMAAHTGSGPGSSTPSCGPPIKTRP
ncbi:hypothetical protein [Nosocomiicoccus sp. HMSC09A07]|uniref:hypothetical protein n=1 Tax=Nosocomiicoccus sp. HMSC09A07 TaxID=1581145 RepID=UPI00143A726A|nr:hypothetical protein [Nosocomiicoccus sp. HMSC09A07]